MKGTDYFALFCVCFEECAASHVHEQFMKFRGMPGVPLLVF